MFQFPAVFMGLYVICPAFYEKVARVRQLLVIAILSMMKIIQRIVKTNKKKKTMTKDFPQKPVLKKEETVGKRKKLSFFTRVQVNL